MTISARDSYREGMLCKELMVVLCSALGSGGLVSRRTAGRRSEDPFQPAGRPAGRFGSGGQLAAAAAAVVRMAAAFRRGARAQHAMVLTSFLGLKAAVLTVSCTRRAFGSCENQIPPTRTQGDDGKVYASLDSPCPMDRGILG